MLASLRTRAIAIVSLVAFLISPALPARIASAQAATFPLAVTDDTAVTTRFTTPPQRIVSLSPGLTEITFALGAGDRLVAVDTFSNYPDAARSIQPRLTTYPSVS